MTHLPICFLIGEKFREVLVNSFFFRSHQSQCTSSNPFWTLCCITHNKNWLAESWSFFLNSTRVGKNQIALVQEIMKIKRTSRGSIILIRSHPAQLFICFLTNSRIHMDWIDCLDVPDAPSITRRIALNMCCIGSPRFSLFYEQ